MPARADAARERLLKAFARQLRSLRTAAGNPTFARLAQLSDWLPTSTTSDLLNGRTRPKLDVVMAFVNACAHHAEEHGFRLLAEEVDRKFWQCRWQQLDDDLEQLLAPATDIPVAVPSDEPVPQAWNLPPPFRTFTRREALLNRIDESFDAAATVPSQSRAVALVGAAGVGKSQLAQAWGGDRPLSESDRGHSSGGADTSLPTRRTSRCPCAARPNPFGPMTAPFGSNVFKRSH